MDNRRKLELVKEATKRKLLTQYQTNFEQFAKQQIKIITKDASKGFVPFIFNEAQQKVNKSIERQKKKFAMLEKEKHVVRLTVMKEKQRRQSEALAWLESHKKT